MAQSAGNRPGYVMRTGPLRASLSDDTTLMADYHLPYVGVLSIAQLVHLARRLPNVIGQALGEFDTDRLLG